ncbi:putative small integral membrane protein [Streptomyces sp. BK022]|nr:putative small integral membrane protein [Streptomyces sp. BK022]
MTMTDSAAPADSARAARSGLSLAATVLTGVLALYIALVAVGNITDFGTNQQYVRHVLAMDTTFKDDHLMWRAISSTALQDTAYVAIIAWETAAAAVLVWGTWLWARRDHARARRFSTYGLLMLILLFGAGFIAIGGEWFAMWQSKTWNGVDAATRVFLLSGVALIVNHLPERDER